MVGSPEPRVVEPARSSEIVSARKAYTFRRREPLTSDIIWLTLHDCTTYPWGGNTVDLKRKTVTSLAIFAVVLGLFAIPGTAAPAKQFSVTAPTSVTCRDDFGHGQGQERGAERQLEHQLLLSHGDRRVGVQIYGNRDPRGRNRQQRWGQCCAEDPVRSFTSIKPTKFIDFTFGVVVPNLACGSGTITWGGVAYAGDSLNGDPFALLGVAFTAVDLDHDRMHNDLCRQLSTTSMRTASRTPAEVRARLSELHISS